MKERRATGVSGFLGSLLPARLRSDAIVIPVVRLSGAIGGASRFGARLTLAAAEGPLRKAFRDRRAPAVAIVVNSPGGAPVQSHLIHRRIRELAADRDKTVIVAVEDVAASGGYLIALAGDEIVADASSIVGSIGVVSASFGFPRLLDRIGIERRVHTVGTNKAILDPFRPERKEDVARLKAIQTDMYDGFVDLVKERRGDRLAEDPDIFSGAFWSGRRSLELGLVDRLGDLRSVLRDKFGDKVRLRIVNPPRGRMFGRLPFGRLRAGAFVDDALDAVEARLMWSRFGL